MRNAVVSEQDAKGMLQELHSNLHSIPQFSSNGKWNNHGFIRDMHGKVFGQGFSVSPKQGSAIKRMHEQYVTGDGTFNNAEYEVGQQEFRCGEFCLSKNSQGYYDVLLCGYQVQARGVSRSDAASVASFMRENFQGLLGIATGTPEGQDIISSGRVFTEDAPAPAPAPAPAAPAAPAPAAPAAPAPAAPAAPVEEPPFPPSDDAF